MPKIALTGGAYTAKSITANAQRCVNLYPELNPPANQSPVPVTHYQTPGLTLLNQPSIPGQARCLYRASNGALYYVIGSRVYFVTPLWQLNFLGSINSTTGQVRMADNGIDVIIVDGTTDGYTVDLTTNAFAQITDPNFVGSRLADYMNTYFLLAKPDQNVFYFSNSNDVTFDPLFEAAKTGWPDPIQGVITMHREVWLIGTLTTEVWYNSGAADTPFEALPGAFIEHGCIAPYSICKQDLSVFWLTQDLQGQALVVKGTGYQAIRISNHALENEISTYGTINDAIGFTYQQEGHVFYMLTFPSANKTWCYDVATEQWHERMWLDANGNENRHRANCCAFAYGKNVVGDWENGNLYFFDPENFTDNGMPISRIRQFPHLLNNMKRVMYRQFIADVQIGTEEDTQVVFENPYFLETEDAVYAIETEDGDFYLQPEDTVETLVPVPIEPAIFLRYSDTRGASWGNRMAQSLGNTGEYYTTPQWQRLGYARDRVFELSWSAPVKTALNAAYVDFIQAAS